MKHAPDLKMMRIRPGLLPVFGKEVNRFSKCNRKAFQKELVSLDLG